MAFSLSACGIKGPPVPPPPPNISIKRIGDFIYIKPNLNQKLKAKGFRYKNGLYVRQDKSSLCFDVKDYYTNTSSVYCVPPAIEKTPIILEAYRKFNIYIHLKGFKNYMIYKHKPNKGFNPFDGKMVKSVVVLPPDFSAVCYDITGVFNSVESPPKEVCFKKENPPAPKTPQNLNFSVYKDKLYLYWEPNQDNGYTKGYLIYKNGKLLTKHPITQNVFVDKIPKSFTIYEVRAVSIFGNKSKPAELPITLKALKQMLRL